MKILLTSIETIEQSSYYVVVTCDIFSFKSLVAVDPNDPPIQVIKIENQILSQFLFLANAADAFARAVFSVNSKRLVVLPVLCGEIDTRCGIGIYEGLIKGESLDKIHEKYPASVTVR